MVHQSKSLSCNKVVDVESFPWEFSLISMVQLEVIEIYCPANWTFFFFFTCNSNVRVEKNTQTNTRWLIILYTLTYSLYAARKETSWKTKTMSHFYDADVNNKFEIIIFSYISIVALFSSKKWFTELRTRASTSFGVIEITTW
jgi:hypothetical protein